MKIHLVVVGSVKGPLATAVQEYETRAARYWKLVVDEVDAGAPGGSDDAGRVREAEAARILSRLPDPVRMVALTRDGSSMASRSLADFLADAALHAQDVAFVVGGAWGLDQTVLAKAERRLSLSALTLPHELARLLLAEQLYRAGTILRGEPYHKGP